MIEDAKAAKNKKDQEQNAPPPLAPAQPSQPIQDGTDEVKLQAQIEQQEANLEAARQKVAAMKAAREEKEKAQLLRQPELLQRPSKRPWRRRHRSGRRKL